MANSVDDLFHYIPPIQVVDRLITEFFEQVNWRYGVPERWFRDVLQQMWSHLHHSTGNPTQINPNWIMLLFAVIASAPPSCYEEIQDRSALWAQLRSNDDYFMCATMARRLVEDDFLNEPNHSLMVSAADGSVLGCLATPLLCDYLAQRGRVSEAWKLAGNAIRSAESVGMHRDPEWKLWQTMSEDEKALRRAGWWGLFIMEKYAYFVLLLVIGKLTRPTFVAAEFVHLFLPGHKFSGLRCTTPSLIPRSTQMVLEVVLILDKTC